jgi:hypothetical protein
MFANVERQALNSMSHEGVLRRRPSAVYRIFQRTRKIFLEEKCKQTMNGTPVFAQDYRECFWCFRSGSGELGFLFFERLEKYFLEEKCGKTMNSPPCFCPRL